MVYYCTETEYEVRCTVHSSVFIMNREISEIGSHGNLLSRSFSRQSWQWNDFPFRHRVPTDYKGRMLESGDLTSHYEVRTKNAMA